MNTYDWLMNMPIAGIDSRYPIVEVSFKNGQRKGYYYNLSQEFITGDCVCVESSVGVEIGEITLSGELVRLQMKKLEKTERSVEKKVIRKASEQELKTMDSFRTKEKQSMIKARAIARQMKLDMKISDVEYQGDGKRAIFYYIADGRVDFRELIKVYAREFNVKVEMKQIGSRQEAGLVGGIGSCGRELCCSTWLTDFKNVNIGVARYQNLSINQAKLSGQCGRLKCCLNFELDTYLEALKEFPKDVDMIKTQRGDAYLQKSDIFKYLMWYSYKGSTKLYPLSVAKVAELKAMNSAGKMPADLEQLQVEIVPKVAKEEYIDVIGQTSLSSLRRTAQRKKSKGKPKPQQGSAPSNTNPNANAGGTTNNPNNNRRPPNPNSNQGNPNQNRNRNKPNR